MKVYPTFLAPLKDFIGFFQCHSCGSYNQIIPLSHNLSDKKIR